MGREVEVQVLEAPGVTLYLLAWPVEAPAPIRLTAAEREVFAGIRSGLSNLEIARARRTSVRTVANQVASLLRKHGVSSRHELIARAGQAP